MKIIHAIAGLSVNAGGPSRSIPALAAALAECGVDVSLLRRHSESEVPFPAGVNDVRLVGKSVTTTHNDKIPLANYLGSYDIVHSHGIWAPFNHQIASHKPKLHIIAPRGMLEPWSLNNSKWKKRLAWWLYQRRDLQNATAFHATAYSEAESIRRLGFKQPIAVIPNGIQLPKATEGILDKEDRILGKSDTQSDDQSRGSKSNIQRSEYSISSGANIQTKRTALFLSRINPKKGLPMLLDAWMRVAPADWRLVIAGNDDGDHQKVVEAKIRELNLSESVEVAGPLFGEAKADAFRNADLFVLPSYSENFGIVVAEALGYGLPVIASTGTPWQELETHNCGWWVEPTEASIEAALNITLGTKNEELSAMGRRGRRLVEKNYQWPAIAERMEVFYEWILNGGTQPSFVV